MLILDLYTEDNPVWQNYDSYFGKQWVWNALMVFGGRRGLYGNLTRIATGPLIDMQTPGVTMTGLGATPEAIEMIPIMFDLLFEMGWRTDFFDVDEWVQQYAVRRYGKYSPSLSQAMAILRSAAYNASIDTTPLEESPQISSFSSRNTNATGILQALRLFVRAATAGEIDVTLGPFLYDLTDLTRQFLLNTWDDYHHLQGIQYQQWQENNINSSASVVPLTTAMMGILHDIDSVVSANENYLLGNWISDAKSWASDADESVMLERNARNQITLWGPGSIAGGNEINDYAAKHWGGLVGDYYGARWQLHGNYLVDSVMQGYQINWTQYDSDILAVEQGECTQMLQIHITVSYELDVQALRTIHLHIPLPLLVMWCSLPA
jgi:alpha-N-acetylglucosaminidase